MSSGLEGDRTRTPRIVVVGTSCAGKTTFARELSRILGLPRIELDELHWGPGWTPRPTEELRRRVAEAAAGESWVTDGNYAMVRDLLWPRATTIVWLNYGFPTVFGRGIRRTVGRCFTREELWNGNRESVRLSFFSKDSILVWIVTSFRRRRREFEILRASGAFPHLSWVELKRPSDGERLLRSLEMRAADPRLGPIPEREEQSHGPAVPEFGEAVPGAHYTLRPGGYVIARNAKGEVALVSTPKGLFLPGGGQDDGETPEQAAVREAFEECGLRVRLTAQVGVADELVFTASEGKHVRKRCTFFSADVIRREAVGEADHELTWIMPEEATNLLSHKSQAWALTQAVLHHASATRAPASSSPLA